MADPGDAAPKASRNPDREGDFPGVEPAAEEDVEERVQRQRRHIEELTGEDPLRGGVDD